MANNLVSYSRAGDVFHYRWAARRCLSLVHPNSFVRSVVIEGSSEVEKTGEYVIDVSEYYKDGDDKREVRYYQLKHTTVQKHLPFVLSDLKNTFEGFAKRFCQHLKESDAPDFSFIIVTNRPLDASLKRNISLLAKEENVTDRFRKTIQQYTGLSAELSKFCSLIVFDDGQGDYNSQKDELRSQLSTLVAGTIDNALIENLVALVQEKATSVHNKAINKEEVLRRFGISSEKDLFPAPAAWEPPGNMITREQHDRLRKEIEISRYPVIVHAPGGVGKSVFCRQLIESLPSHSLGLAYDCFGAGRYRNRSELRHRHRDALVQIANELAVRGLCNPLLVTDTSPDTDIMRKFLDRLESSVKALQQKDELAVLYILIDAADNAEMAAQEFSHACFAHELLREVIPDGCKLVMLSRTERVKLLKPSAEMPKLMLTPFSEGETLENLQQWFPGANEKDGGEFHRLTAGNPRVQANALDGSASTISEMLGLLGPAGTTVEEQIERLLDNAVAKIRAALTDNYQPQAEAICVGLASLPPHIPITVLARAARVEPETIKSFVADLGRSLWLTDSSVQFRDEPAETWFKKKFLTSKESYLTYIQVLEPLANQSVYVAEVLPQLYLQAEQYNKLIDIALSEDFLPDSNPIDTRNVRVFRLQFAFRAALKVKNYPDAVKIAMRAGEEVAGNLRQLNLFQSNVDLLTVLQGKQKVQEIAFKRLLRGGWFGSENVYTASLLAGINEYRGEARGYLRASINYLLMYYKELDQSEDIHIHNAVTDQDILEIAYANFNIHGVKECVEFLNRFRDKRVAFGIMKDLTKRLLDFGKHEAIDSFLQHCSRQAYYIIAITSELIKVGIFPEAKWLAFSLGALSRQKPVIKKQENFHNITRITSAIISFAEVCLHWNLSGEKVLKMLQHFSPEEASTMVYSRHHFAERDLFLRVLSIRTFLAGKSEINVDDILPKSLREKKNGKSSQSHDNDIREFKEMMYGLFPWYFLRIRIISCEEVKFEEEVASADRQSVKARANRYRTYDTLLNEIAALQAEILIIYGKASGTEIIWFYQKYLKNSEDLWLPQQLEIVRAAFRVPHLSNIRKSLEQSTYERIREMKDYAPDQIAENYIHLSRSVVNIAQDDASVYFDEAVMIVSKFGDEIVSRWEATVSLGRQACIDNKLADELAYRFIRTAEVVGKYASDNGDWYKNEALALCARMSPGICISALRRWRDRDVGWFDDQFKALFTELIRLQKISGAAGWALARLLSDHHLEEFLSLCLKNEHSVDAREKIFSDAVRLLQVESSTKAQWGTLQQIAIKYDIDHEELNMILASCQADDKPAREKDELESVPLRRNVVDEISWDEVFAELDILHIDQFAASVQRFSAISEKHYYRDMDSFWRSAIDRISEANLWRFIDVVLLSEINIYEMKAFFSSLPQEWLNKISFIKRKPEIVRQLGKKYAVDLVNLYTFRHFVEDLNLNTAEIDKLKIGVFNGLADGYELSEAETFFGFVNLAAREMTQHQARELLDFSLSRFEMHVESEFGDGEWNESLAIDHDVHKSIAGFIWSFLGSPRSTERWNAVHVVKAVAELNCVPIIDELVNWMRHDRADAYGSREFPFYNLHARLYLLIAFSRVSLQYSQLLLEHKDVFVYYALAEPHILVQRFASEIACRLETLYPGSYDKATIGKLKSVGKSKEPIGDLNESKNIEDQRDEPREIDDESNFHFGLDIGEYWYKPLGKVFGVSARHVERMASNVINQEWGLAFNGSYKDDPRSVIWDNSTSRIAKETWYRKTEYPRTDNLNFYLSYHAMFVVASKLLNVMPVKKGRWSEDAFSDWLSIHLLTRQDGKWLSDAKGPSPINRPDWINDEKDDNWRTNITDDNFFKLLVIREGNEVCVNVVGGWEEKHDERIENVSVTSAIVSKESSAALLRALQTCSDPYDYKLPDYEEEDNEINSNPFMLKGWIKDDSVSKRLDEYDPYADNIDYPPYEVGEEFARTLSLSSDEEHKIWYNSETKLPVLKSEIWSSYRRTRDENPDQAGKRLRASLSLLKVLCIKFNCNLIFDVTISREIRYKYRDDKNEYTKPQHKLFILTEDGILEDAGRNYQLG